MRPSNRASRLALPPHLWRLKPFVLLVVDLSDWLFPFVAVNLLWLLLSLTVVLFPPATAALFDTVFEAYRGHPPSASAFLRRARRWLVPAWIWGGANLLIIGGVILLARTLESFDWAAALLAGLAALVLLAQMFFWPYAVLQEKPSLAQAWRNSLFTVLADPLLTGLNLALMAVLLLPGVLLIAPVLFILPVLLAQMLSYTLLVWLEHRQLLPGPTRDI